MYREAVEDLESRGSDRKDPAIEPTKEALESLGLPQESYDLVLVGGTNGKGSVVEMSSEMLQYKGKKVGVYKSPHLETCRERIKVNGEMVSKSEFVDLYQEIDELDLDLSFFEFMTVMAYRYFEKKEVDYAVMEVGMGGRLDATNAVDNSAAVITNIGLDHSQYLGDTREEIGREKAGIIPENGFVITDTAVDSVNTTAEDRSSEIIEPETVEKINGDYIYEGSMFQVPVKGDYQAENLGNALALIDAIESIPDDLDQALRGLSCPGRMEVISENPLYIQDGAHNVEAIRELVKEIPEGSRCVFNAVEGKDIGEMISLLEEKVSKFYFTTSDISWCKEPEALSKHASVKSEKVNDPAEAVKLALEEAEEQDTVVVTGSLYLIGAIKSRQK